MTRVVLAAALVLALVASGWPHPGGIGRASATVPESIVVGLGDAELAALRSRVEPLAGARVEPLALAGFARVSVRPQDAGTALALVEGLPGVASVERDPIAHAADLAPRDPQWHEQWSAHRVDAPAAWQTTSGTPGIVVAVLDTGVVASHPELAGAVVGGVNLVERATAPLDRNGHGTEVAGIVAARAGNGVGAAGICPRCSILPIKVLDDAGDGPLSRVAEGLVIAADRGAHVANLSLGSFGESTAMESAVRYARARGVVVVAAAGNYGDTPYGTEPIYPAAYPGVVSVAGSEADDSRAAWTTHGSWVSVAAPGCSVTSTLSHAVRTVCGSSAATPVVAGILGLAASVPPRAPGDALAQAVTSSTRPVAGYVRHGRVDAPAALRAVRTLRGLAPVALRWSEWAPQPEGPVSAPAAVSWSWGRSDLFAVDAAGRLVQRWHQSGQSWAPAGGWHVHGHPSGVRLVGAPAVISRGRGMLDVFARGADDAVWQRSYRLGQGWSGWISRGGRIDSAPSAVTWREGHVSIVVKSHADIVYERRWTDGRWTSWTPIGYHATSAPSVASWGPGRMDVFVRGAQGQLWHMPYTGGRWYGRWLDLGGVLVGDGRPDAVSWGDGRLDVFVLGGRGVYHKAYHRGFGWLPSRSGFDLHGKPSATMTSGTAAMSWGRDMLQVFATDGAGRVWHRWTT